MTKLNDPNSELFAKARELVEEFTHKPAYLADEDEWYGAVGMARALLGITESAPVCPFCGSVAPYGDERLVWISVHDGRMHRWWWTRKERKG